MSEQDQPEQQAETCQHPEDLRDGFGGDTGDWEWCGQCGALREIYPKTLAWNYPANHQAQQRLQELEAETQVQLIEAEQRIVQAEGELDDCEAANFKLVTSIGEIETARLMAERQLTEAQEELAALRVRAETAEAGERMYQAAADILKADKDRLVSQLATAVAAGQRLHDLLDAQNNMQSDLSRRSCCRGSGYDADGLIHTDGCPLVQWRTQPPLTALKRQGEDAEA